MAFENPQVLSTENYFPICSAASQHTMMCDPLWDHKTSPIIDLSEKKNALSKIVTRYLSFIHYCHEILLNFFPGQILTVTQISFI